MSDFRFVYPVVLSLLLLPLTVSLAVQRGWVGKNPGFRFSDTRLMDGLPITWRIRLRWVPDLLRIIAWMILVIALARPQGGQSQSVLRGQGIEISLALDISGSMAALDFLPLNRLKAAKNVIADFIDGREFDRIGLVVFAHESFSQVPPTLDYNVLLNILSSVELSTTLGIEDGTAIGMGLASAINQLRDGQAKNRVVVLLTDGANNAGAIDPMTAAEAARTLGTRVYTIGMGRPGLVPFPDEQGGTFLAESDIDEAVLQAIAGITGGLYFRAADMTGLQQIYDEIDRLERSDMERTVVTRWQELFPAWITAALGLLFAERILRYTIFQTLP